MAAPVVPGAAASPLSDLTGVCFRDQIFLNFVGGTLSANNVFDYFATSPFYDRSCTNEQMRMQGIHPLDMAQLVKMAGRKSTAEYVLQQVQEPHLFVLKKQIREGPGKATPVAMYYVLDGSIYQAPALYGVIGARMARALHHVERAFADCRGKLEREKAAGEGTEGKPGKKTKEEIQKKTKGAVEKPVDFREVARMDQILSAVFSKLPPAPPPPPIPGVVPLGTAEGGGGPPIGAMGPTDGEAKDGGEQESGVPVQGPAKRLKREKP